MTDLKRYRLDCADGEWTPYDEAERALLQARADAEAAVAAVVEQAAKPLTDEEAYSAALSHRHDLGLLAPRDQELECSRARWWHEALSHRLRALAPASGMATLQGLRAEIEGRNREMLSMEQLSLERKSRAEAAEAEVARLQGIIKGKTFTVDEAVELAAEVARLKVREAGLRMALVDLVDAVENWAAAGNVAPDIEAALIGAAYAGQAALATPPADEVRG